jgi:hypothetical protein
VYNSYKFQGAKISLNELMSAESPAANVLSLSDLLEGKELKIADPGQISKGYNGGYYIGRIFRIQRAIIQDIINDKNVTDSRVCLARSVQEYKQFSQLNPKSNVHWLPKEKAGTFLWQQSKGSLETIRRHIDTDGSHTYTDGDLVQLLEKAQH